MPFLTVAVKDSGIGISKEDQGQLFKLFGALKAGSKINTKGIGLGLCITQQVCQSFGGDVSVESDLGQGATFTLVFKLEEGG